MKQLVEFALAGGDVILVEVDAPAPGRPQMRGLADPQAIVEKAKFPSTKRLTNSSPRLPPLSQNCANWPRVRMKSRLSLALNSTPPPAP